MLIQIVLIVALIIALFVTWKRARQNVISRLEAFGWSVAWIAAAVVIILPQTTTTVANFFGVGRGVDFVLYASVISLFFLVFNIFIKLDRLDRKLTDVVRKVALDAMDVKKENGVALDATSQQVHE
jgi:small membrane protein